MVGGDRVLDSYFSRDDVLEFIKELETSPKYRKMIVHEESRYGKNVKDELALYLFYDIILKYKKELISDKRSVLFAYIIIQIRFSA